MSEMLGNRYFLSRKFDKAIPELETALQDTADDAKIRKKLIICYIQVGQIEKALPLFMELLFQNPMIIIDTDPYHDDCPCPTLVEQWEDIIQYKEEPVGTEFLALGMLYLYCDIHKSIAYFKNALDKMENNTSLQQICNRLIDVRDNVIHPS